MNDAMTNAFPMRTTEQMTVNENMTMNMNELMFSLESLLVEFEAYDMLAEDYSFTLILDEAFVYLPMPTRNKNTTH